MSALLERVSTRELRPTDFDHLWAFRSRFVDSERAGFEASVRRYDELLRFRDPGTDEVLGAAFVGVDRPVVDGRRVVVLITGMVLLDERFRGRNLLQRAGAHSFLRARLRFPGEPIYWFFTSASYASYLLLPRNFKTYWPRHGTPTPAREQRLLHAIAESRYGEAWDRARGVLRYEGIRWRDGVNAPDERALRDPHVAFFLDRNPGWGDMDALGCLCPLSADNWLHLGQRAMSRVMRRWAPAARTEPVSPT